MQVRKYLIPWRIDFVASVAIAAIAIDENPLDGFESQWNPQPCAANTRCVFKNLCLGDDVDGLLFITPLICAQPHERRWLLPSRHCNTS